MRVTLLTLLTQVFSFISSVMIARLLGATHATDAYFLGYAIPVFVASVFLTAIRAGAIPALTQEAGRASETFANAACELVSITLIGTLILSLLAAGFSVILMPLTAGGDGLVSSAQLAALALTPLGPFGAMVSALAAILAVRNRFAAAALVVGIDPILRIVLLGIFGSSLGTTPLIIANVAGNGLAVVVMWLLVLREGIPLRLHWPAGTPFVRRTIALTVPIVLSQIAVGTNPVLDRAMTAKLGAGSITALELGFRLFGMPLTLIGATLVGPLTATWAARRATEGIGALSDSVNRGIDTFTMIAPPLVVLGIVLRHQVVSLIYHGGGYTTHATNQTAAVLAMCELGAPAMLLGIAFATLSVVEGRSKFVLMTGLLNFALNAVLDYALRGSLGVAGIALSTSVTYTTVLAVFIVATRRRWPGVKLPLSGRSGMRVLLASAAMIVAVLALTSVFATQSNRVDLAVEIILVSLAGLALYTAIVLNRDQRQNVIAVVQRRFGRPGWIGAQAGEAGR
jgi:putative peptidoglycan lipid II flippase